MQLLETLSNIANSKRLSFVVIGGHALNFVGYGRTTRDLDIAVSSEQRTEWRNIMISLGYKLFHEQPGFIQFSVPDLGHWPIDIMIVNEQTYKKLEQEATECAVLSAHVKVASIHHLIAMKLHSLKNNEFERFAKDATDILELLKIANIAVESEDFRQMVTKHGTMRIYEKLKQLTR